MHDALFMVVTAVGTSRTSVAVVHARIQEEQSLGCFSHTHSLSLLLRSLDIFLVLSNACPRHPTGEERPGLLQGSWELTCGYHGDYYRYLVESTSQHEGIS